MTDETFDVLVSKIEVLSLGPDDTIILTSPRLLTAESAHHLKERLAAALTITTNRVVVLDGGLDMKVLRDTETDLERRLAALEDPATIRKMLVQSASRQRNWSDL